MPFVTGQWPDDHLEKNRCGSKIQFANSDIRPAREVGTLRRPSSDNSFFTAVGHAQSPYAPSRGESVDQQRRGGSSLPDGNIGSA
jgi:hypothetical protein